MSRYVYRIVKDKVVTTDSVIAMSGSESLSKITQRHNVSAMQVELVAYHTLELE